MTFNWIRRGAKISWRDDSTGVLMKLLLILNCKLIVAAAKGSYELIHNNVSMKEVVGK